jgi:hypothetical protein
MEAPLETPVWTDASDFGKSTVLVAVP